MEDRLVKVFSGEASEDEIKEVRMWRGATEANAKAFLEAKKIWLASAPIMDPDPALLGKILGEEEKEFEIIPLWNQKLFRIAAALVIGLGLVFGVLRLTQEGSQPYGRVVAEVTAFTLEDGSTVTLQRGASLEVEDFDDNRKVRLTGKAFFEVERDEKRPFIVTTPEALIEVLGTSFLVNSTPTAATEVMVTSGLVELGQNPETFDGEAMEIRLGEGEMGKLSVGERGIQKRKINDKNYLAWKTRELAFKSTSLEKVSEVLADVYGLRVNFEESSLKNCRLTASFKDKSAEDIINIIAETFNFTYVKGDDNVSFTGDGCSN